jgi:hypothetical protein
MAGTWIAAPLQPFSLNATPAGGPFYNGAAPGAGYASSGTSTIAAATAWSGGAPYGVAVPNPSGNVILWWTCGATGSGIAQVLVGEQLLGQVLPATTAITIGATASSGWFGPFSPATYNVQNVANPPASSVVTGNMPAAYQGCFVVTFTLATSLTVAAFTFAAIQP